MGKRAFIFAGIGVAVLAFWLQRDWKTNWQFFIFSLNFLLAKPAWLSDYSNDLTFNLSLSWPIKYGTRIPPRPFPEMPGQPWNPKMFEIVSDDWTKPIIIRGLFSDVPGFKWTVEMLANHFGRAKLYGQCGQYLWFG